MLLELLRIHAHWLSLLTWDDNNSNDSCLRSQLSNHNSHIDVDRYYNRSHRVRYNDEERRLFAFDRFELERSKPHRLNTPIYFGLC